MPMTTNSPCLNNYLIVGAMLFGIGLIGFLSRRNMIVMFLSAEMMLQGVSLSLVAWGRFHNDFGGQMLVMFIIAVAACEAAIALALILMLFRAPRQAWTSPSGSDLREANQPPLRRPTSCRRRRPTSRGPPGPRCRRPAIAPGDSDREETRLSRAMFDISDTADPDSRRCRLAAALLTAALGTRVLRPSGATCR